MAADLLYLPDECWECVFGFLNDGHHDHHHHHRYLKTLSLVSKHFLSITNRLRFSLRVLDPTLLPFLPRLFHRFPNITSLDVRHFYGDRNAFLFQISRFRLNLKSLDLSTYQTVALNRCYSYDGILCLISNCRFLQHLDLQNVKFLNDQHVTTLSLFLGDLVSINLSECDMLTDSALFALVRNCPLLSHIRMKDTGIGKRDYCYNISDSNSFVVEDSNSLVANPQVKSLNLGFNLWLRDESIKTIASICPNLQMLDLSYCYNISDDDDGIIMEVLRRCCKIRHLSLAYNRVKLLGMKNFEVPNLEVLNLSYSGVDDETLYVISKSCCGLLQLDLCKCLDVTEKGVRLVVENCTHLREIDLRYCHHVADDVVAWMVVSRPSLRKIVVPSGYCPSDLKKEFLLKHQCLLV